MQDRLSPESCITQRYLRYDFSLFMNKFERGQSVKERTTNRREWSAQPTAPEREVADVMLEGLALATPSHGLAEQDQDGGMSTD